MSTSKGERGFIDGTAVPVSAHAFLSDLERAARHAELERDRAMLRVAEVGVANATDPPSPAQAGDDGAITSAHETLRQRRAARVSAAQPPPVPALDEVLTGIDTVDDALRAAHRALVSAPAPDGPAPSQYLAWARALRAAAQARARGATTNPTPGPRWTDD